MQTSIRLLCLQAISCLCFTVPATAERPFFNSRIVTIGGGACVTPVRSFNQPVFDFNAPVVTSHIVDHHSPVVVGSHIGNDVNTALKIITDFKLQQQTLDQGLQSLGYNSGGGYGAYGQAQGPYVNYGLAPYAQGTTQFQVETFNHSTFENNVDDLSDKINSLLRLSENMQRSTASVSASVTQSVQKVAEAQSQQVAAQAKMKHHELDAATKMAALELLYQILQGNHAQHPAPCPDGTCPTPAPQPVPQPAPQLDPVVPVPMPMPPVVSDEPIMTTFSVPPMLVELCGACHMGDANKGNFSMNGPLSEKDFELAAASVFKGEMPKGTDRTLSVKEIQQVVMELESIKQR